MQVLVLLIWFSRIVATVKRLTEIDTDGVGNSQTSTLGRFELRSAVTGKGVKPLSSHPVLNTTVSRSLQSYE
jgi:hypothetical protein